MFKFRAGCLGIWSCNTCKFLGQLEQVRYSTETNITFQHSIWTKDSMMQANVCGWRALSDETFSHPLLCHFFATRSFSYRQRIGKETCFQIFFCRGSDFSVKAMSQFALPLCVPLPFDRGVKLVGAQHWIIEVAAVPAAAPDGGRQAGVTSARVICPPPL